MTWLQEHWFKVGILIALLLFAASPAYYFMVYIPHRDAVEQEALTAQQERAATQKTDQYMLLQACLADAATNYASTWASDCVTAGTSNKGCTLPIALANSVNQSLQNDKETCLKEYPQSGN